MESAQRTLDVRLLVSLVACGIMSFSGVVVETAMNITFPALMDEFSVDTSTVQWITTGYLLTLTAIMPISSFLKRRFKMKLLFTVAVSVFFIGTVMCAAAPVFWALIAGRVLQGVGAGIALPLMFNIVIEQAPLDKMGLMMGVATLITATAPAVGPSVGGLIVTCWGWRMIFVVLMPFLILSAIGGIACIRQVGKTSPVHFSAVQFLLVAAGFSCLVFAANSASSAGWLSARVLGLAAAGVAMLVAFGVLSRHSESPLIKIAIFRKAPFTFSVAYVVLIAAIVLGLGYLIPYYSQTVCGSNEFEAGCLLLPGCIIGAILSPMGGRILDMLGARRPITFGSICQLVAIVCFILFALGSEPWVFALIYVLIPIAQGFSMANSITNGLSYLPDDLKSDGNAAFNTLQQLGGAMGTAIVTSIMGSAQAAQPGNLLVGTVAGSTTAFWCLLGMSVLGLCCSLAVFIVTPCKTKRG